MICPIWTCSLWAQADEHDGGVHGRVHEFDHSNIGMTDGIYTVLSTDEVKEFIGRLGQNIVNQGNVSSAAVDKLAAMLLQRLSDLRGESVTV